MTDWGDFAFLTGADRLEEDVRLAISLDPVRWVTRPKTDGPDDVCHLCSDRLDLGTPQIIDFGDDRTLAVHAECHRTREGLSGPACMLALKFGVKLVSITLKGDAATGWERDMIGDFITQHGRSLGDRLLGHGVAWWGRDDAITGLDDFVRFTRDIFLHEREAPKFEFYGGRVPAWDPDAMSWSAYKREAAVGRGPFYAELKRLQAAYRVRHGRSAPARRHPPYRTVLDRTGSRCAFCAGEITSRGLPRLGCARDHILPLTRGGTNDVGNFQPLHQFCNGAKNSFNGGHFPLAVLMGRWLLESSEVAGTRSRRWWPKIVRDLSKVVG